MPRVIPIILIAAALTLTGCGQPGLPMPPSLHLPQAPNNLTAARTGNTITLRWTMPKSTTDKELIRGPITAEIWMRTIPYAAANSAPHPANAQAVNTKNTARPPFNDPDHPFVRIGSINFLPGATAEFVYKEPPASTTQARIQIWTIRLLSPSGRFDPTAATEPNNQAFTLDTPAVPTPASPAAEYASDGVHLTWQPLPAQSLANISSQSIRVHRHLVTPPSPLPAHTTLVPDADLTLPGDPGIALDATAFRNAQYTYTLQRATETYNGGDTYITTLSDPTAVISLSTKDTFAPAQPTGLAAVLNTSPLSADLSWNPNTEPDLAGYIVRRADTPVSGTAPISTPAFRDDSLSPRTHACWTITAVDTSGNQSKPSAPECLDIP